MKTKLMLSVLALVAVTVAGCGGQQVVKPTTAGGAAAGGQGAQATGAGQGSGTEGSALGTGQSATAEVKHTVYFAFDSSQIDDENRAIVEANAAYMTANPQVSVTLQGNTDERGTREYNLALGERRAKSVARMLEVLGVSSDRIKTVSFGEEKPVALGHNESAWRLNRRVDFAYN